MVPGGGGEIGFLIFKFRVLSVRPLLPLYVCIFSWYSHLPLTKSPYILYHIPSPPDWTFLPQIFTCMIRMVHMLTATRIICPNKSIRIPSIIWNWTDRRYQSSHPGTGLGMPPTTAGGLTCICPTHMQNPAQNVWWQTYMNVMIRVMYVLMMEGGLLMEESYPMDPLSGINILHMEGFLGCVFVHCWRTWEIG